MCVGLPGRVVEVVDPEHHIVRVEVAGETHDMSAALIAHEGIAAGDWVEIHMGHAYTKLTEEEAQEMLAFMEELDAAHRGDLERLRDELGDELGAGSGDGSGDGEWREAPTRRAGDGAADGDDDGEG